MTSEAVARRQRARDSNGKYTSYRPPVDQNRADEVLEGLGTSMIADGWSDDEITEAIVEHPAFSRHVRKLVKSRWAVEQRGDDLVQNVALKLLTARPEWSKTGRVAPLITVIAKQQTFEMFKRPTNRRHHERNEYAKEVASFRLRHDRLPTADEAAEMRDAIRKRSRYVLPFSSVGGEGDERAFMPETATKMFSAIQLPGEASSLDEAAVVDVATRMSEVDGLRHRDRTPVKKTVMLLGAIAPDNIDLIRSEGLKSAVLRQEHLMSSMSERDRQAIRGATTEARAATLFMRWANRNQDLIRESVLASA